MQDPLDTVALVALLEERQRDPPSPPPSIGVGCFVESGGGPFRVHRLEWLGEAPQMTVVHRCEIPSDGDGGLAVGAGQIEGLEPGQGPYDRGAVPGSLAEPERKRGDLELQGPGPLVELRGQVAQQEQRGRPERRQPERLGVQRARIVSDGVEPSARPGKTPAVPRRQCCEIGKM